MHWTFEELRQLEFGFVSGSTNQKFKTILDNNIKKIEKQNLPESIISSFKNREYNTYITLDEIVLYRVYGLTLSGQAGAKQLGAFATTEFAESRIDVKMHPLH